MIKVVMIMMSMMTCSGQVSDAIDSNQFAGTRARRRVEDRLRGQFVEQLVAPPTEFRWTWTRSGRCIPINP